MLRFLNLSTLSSRYALKQVAVFASTSNNNKNNENNIKMLICAAFILNCVADYSEENVGNVWALQFGFSLKFNFFLERLKKPLKIDEFV